MAPNERGAGFTFEDRITSGAIPKQFIPAVERGVVGAMESGGLAGYPVVDVRARADHAFVPRVDFFGRLREHGAVHLAVCLPALGVERAQRRLLRAVCHDDDPPRLHVAATRTGWLAAHC
ncbi:MAG: hypothetical protein ACE5FL_11815 [Myxococcota bacterium]